VLYISKLKQVAGRGGELLIHKAKSRREMKGAGKGGLRTFSRVLHEDMK
jgi:hypothetical protein